MAARTVYIDEKVGTKALRKSHFQRRSQVLIRVPHLSGTLTACLIASLATPAGYSLWWELALPLLGFSTFSSDSLHGDGGRHLLYLLVLKTIDLDLHSTTLQSLPLYVIIYVMVILPQICK